MIEITKGTLKEQIIKILQDTYPVTIEDISKRLHLSKTQITRVLKKLQMQQILVLEELPDKTYIRLIRHDFSFIGKKRQRKFIKHSKKNSKKQTDEYNGIMYS